MGSPSDSFQKWEDKPESQVCNYVCQDGFYFLMSLRDKIWKAGNCCKIRKAARVLAKHIWDDKALNF